MGGGKSLKSLHSLINAKTSNKPAISVTDSFREELELCIQKMDKDSSRTPSKSYKPSSMACVRNMYYQIVGATPSGRDAGACLIGICQTGSHRHEILQDALMKMKDYGFDCEYVDVETWINSRGIKDLKVVSKDGAETKLYHKRLNISFKCDGIVRYRGHYYILEIKTESIHKFLSRSDVAPEHKAQACCYSYCLEIEDVLFLYENRDNCSKKPYIFKATEELVREEVLDKIELCEFYLKDFVVPPKPKEVSKKACEYCSYRDLCKEDK